LGQFLPGEIVSGDIGGLGTADSLTPVVDGDVDIYTGDVLYIENRTAVDRVSDQTEDIKLVINF